MSAAERLVTGVSYVRIFVSNLEDALGFYTDILGFSVETSDRGDGWALLSCRDPRLLLVAVSEEEQKMERLVGRFCGISFSTPDIQSAYDSLSKKGVQFTDPPVKHSWGGTIANFLDPDSNVLTLIQV